MRNPATVPYTRPSLALSCLVFALTGCAFSTQFTGSARVEGGRDGCVRKCTQWGMELDAMVAIGEYSDACVCRDRANQIASPAPAVAPPAPAVAPPSAAPPAPGIAPPAAPPAPAPTSRSGAGTGAIVAAAAGVSIQMDREQQSRHDASVYRTR